MRTGEERGNAPQLRFFRCKEQPIVVQPALSDGHRTFPFVLRYELVELCDVGFGSAGELVHLGRSTRMTADRRVQSACVWASGVTFDFATPPSDDNNIRCCCASARTSCEPFRQSPVSICMPTPARRARPRISEKSSVKPRTGQLKGRAGRGERTHRDGLACGGTTHGTPGRPNSSQCRSF